MVSGARFKKLRGGPYCQKGRGELNSQRGQDSQELATMFFCKHIIFVATLLLIIHITMYILSSWIKQNSWHKTMMTLFSHTIIKCCFGRMAYSKYCIVVYLSSCSVLVEKWCRALLDCLFDIFLLQLHSSLFSTRLAIGICSGIIWESERNLKPLKLLFSLGRPMWYHFRGLFFAEFSFQFSLVRNPRQISHVKQI